MKIYFWICFMSLIFAIVFSCAKPSVAPVKINTQDEQALYDLMALRVQAINKTNMDLFRKIYTKDSPEIKWIEETGISQWRKNGMKYGQPSLKKISIIGNDAAATFRLNGSNEFGKIFIFNVEVLYVKVDSEWKIESTGAR